MPQSKNNMALYLFYVPNSSNQDVVYSPAMMRGVSYYFDNHTEGLDTSKDSTGGSH